MKGNARAVTSDDNEVQQLVPRISGRRLVLVSSESRAAESNTPFISASPLHMLLFISRSIVRSLYINLQHRLARGHHPVCPRAWP